jgi:hypothetical protein
MTRKEFLQHVGAALLMAFGIAGLLSALTKPQMRKASHGYGFSAYGGASKR